MGETAQQQPTVTGTRQAIPSVASLVATPERIDAMWALKREERIAAAKRGEMLQWAARRPHEVPIVNGEFFFIAAFSADRGHADEED
jgi:hypothetical protein